jgi:hypothetical protein
VYSEWTPDDGQRNSPKHVEFHDKNKFAKLVHLVGLSIKEICYDARSHERIYKESRNRLDVGQRVPGGLGTQISWHSAREGGEVVSLKHRPPLPLGIDPGTHFN